MERTKLGYPLVASGFDRRRMQLDIVRARPARRDKLPVPLGPIGPGKGGWSIYHIGIVIGYGPIVWLIGSFR